MKRRSLLALALAPLLPKPKVEAKGFGLAPMKAEGAEIPFDSQIQYEPKQYSQTFKVAKEMLSADNWLVIDSSGKKTYLPYYSD